jgi:hypothetical protein
MGRFLLCLAVGAWARAQTLSEVKDCTWLSGKLHVSWNAPADVTADYYEVQMASAEDSNITAVFSTEQTDAVLDFLASDRTYWVKVRAHRAGMPSLGPGTWLQTGTARQCKTGAAAMQRTGASSRKGSFLLEVLRQSEYTYDVDYLMNHNSGDISGDTSFVASASRDPNQTGFLNTTFRWSTFTLYCVEVLDVHVSDTITTEGDTRYADYLSCDDNDNATDPQCGCDNSIDRFLSKAKDQMKYCHSTSGGPCNSSSIMRSCKCECSQQSLELSAKYTGMMPVYYGQDSLLGHWYSHPKLTECHENEVIGSHRDDGTQCTWTRHGEARVLRGADVLAAGWNASGGFMHHLDPALVKQNAQVFRKSFDSQPFQQWACEGNLGNTLLV